LSSLLNKYCKYITIRLIYLKNLIHQKIFGDILEIEIKNELKNIKSAFKKNLNEFVVIYDNSVSPVTYGDYLYVLILARYFLMHDKIVKFYIINSGFREYENSLTESQKIFYLNEQINLAEWVLKSKLNNIKITAISWEDFIRIKFEKSLIIFSEFIYKRERIYSKSFNLLNKLLSCESKELIDKVLFNKSDFQYDCKIPPNQYILFACRYVIPSDGRNIEDREFIYLYTILKKRFPNHDILVLSDEIGCNHFAQIANINNFKCLFSNSFTTNFIDNLQLILEGDFFFQYKGGGIATFALFSQIPYECIIKPIHEKMFNKNKFCSWQNKNQKFLTNISLPIY
jgi:hypothetical protein